MSFFGRTRQDEALAISRCADVVEAASYFIDKGVGLVVITRGAEGAFAMSESAESCDRSAVAGHGQGTSGEQQQGRRTWTQHCSKVEV